ncbi:NADP-binding protein [Pseudoalteromonas fenneropenaei]|uniref:NADP-binding protein n=1 Tax=Pseudoalteromonas fenneropenaei TaxID=1737459 RepID=A0ABV7CJS2_9GAMM
MTKRLIVLGAGWLGKPLCEHFLAAGWQVEGTQRIPQPLPYLRRCVLEQGELNHNLDLKQAYWVCAVPPRARTGGGDYLAFLQASLELAAEYQAQGFVLCSSTAVYANNSGRYDEQAALAEPTPRTETLLAAEQLVLQSGGKVLRLAGLIGPGREPGQFVAGKNLSSAAADPVNMVHQGDVIKGIATLLDNWPDANTIYNLCYPAHPDKESYYARHCAAAAQQPPVFTGEQSVVRIIDGSAITELGMAYTHPI